MSGLDRQRGSALVLALLVVFILTLLGTSFLLMAQTESLIARNEKHAAQARYVAEAGALAVKTWFDRPGIALGFPTAAQIDFTQRAILDSSDPYGATTGSSPKYKEGVAPPSGIFRKPYRGSLEHALMGTAAGPDMLLDDGTASPSRQFLIDLTAALLGGFKTPGTNLTARISRIAIHAPPYVQVSGGQWTRMGMGTVRVTARIYALNEQITAEQSVSVVLNEVPYSTPIFGPLHTCGDLDVEGLLPVHWGTVTAFGPIEFTGFGPPPPDQNSNLKQSFFRRIPNGPGLERLWATTPAEIADFMDDCDTNDVDDAWLRIFGRTSITGPDPVTPNAEPDPPDTWQPWSEENHNPSPGPGPNWTNSCDDRSNIIAEHPLVGCPAYDYDFWKRLARSGAPNVHYYVPEIGGGFQEDGVGAIESFRDITRDATGFYFFDTTDGLAPHDDDADGTPNNLSTDVMVFGDWAPRGFIYLNSGNLIATGLNDGSAPQATFRAPGEPYLDVNGDSSFTPATDAWINLDYPDTVLGADSLVDENDDFKDVSTDPIPTRNRRGPPIDGGANLYGILINSGGLELVGPGGRFYGGLIAAGDVVLDGDSYSSDQGVFWDASIGVDWPPPELELPLVAITRWNFLP